MIAHWPQWLILFALIVRFVFLCLGFIAGHREIETSVLLMLWITIALAFVLWIGGFFSVLGVN